MITATLGLDNIAVGFALGPLRLGPRRTIFLGVCFAAAESGMMLLGSRLGTAWLPQFMAGDATRAAVLATLAVAILGLAWVRWRPGAFVGHPGALVALALLLGIDNLVAGASPDISASPALAVVASGVLSGALSALACAAGALVFQKTPRMGVAASALMLIGLAVVGIG